MASSDIRDMRSASCTMAGVLFLLLILGLMGTVVWAQQPPPPESEEESDALFLDEPPEQEMTPEPADAAETEDLEAAKQAALASIDKAAATTQRVGPPGTTTRPGRPGMAGRPGTGIEKTTAPGAVTPGKPGSPIDKTSPKDARTPAGPGGRPGPQITPKQGAATPPGKSQTTPVDRSLPPGARGAGAGKPGAAGVTPATPPTPGGTPGVTPAGPVTPVGQAGRPGRPGGPAAGAAKPAGAEGEGTLTATTGPAPISNTNTLIWFGTMGPPDPDFRTYRFDYENTPWMGVLADVSRITGLPWLNQPDQPLSDTLTFRSPRDFTCKEYLDQLNELLLERPTSKYMVQRKDNYLTISRLPDLMKSIPIDRMFNSFAEFEAAKLDRLDLAKTRFKVPKGWSAYQVIEKFRPEFSDTYGTEAVGEDEIELTGLVKEHYRFRDVVEKLAQEPPPPPDPRPMLTIELKTSKAVDVANILKQLYPGVPPSPKGAGATAVDPIAQAAKQVTIIPDVVNNRLIIRAQLDVLGEIGKTVQSLDSGTPSEEQTMKTVKLEHANAITLQAVLKPLFAAQKASMAQKATKEYVSPARLAEADRDLVGEATSNSVILVGSKRGVENAELLVKEWDVADTNDVTEIIELQHAEAQVLASTLQAILAPQAQKGAPAPRIAPQSSSKLLVCCNKNEFQRVRELIDKLDIPQADEATPHFVHLQTAVPSAVAQTLAQLVTGQAAPRMAPRPPAAPGQPAPPAMPVAATAGANGAKFIPDDATGLLIVYCTDKDWERVEPLIQKLDGQAGDNEPRLETFALQNANAADVVLMLQQLFPAPVARGPGAPAQMVTADTFHNAVKVFARADFIEKVTPFITQLDVESEWPLTVIKLDHTKAELIAPILMQSVGGGSSGQMRIVQPPAAPGQPPRPMPSTGGGSSGVRIVAETVTNSLLVTAPPKELAQIQDLVAKMEEAEGEKAEEQIILTPQHRSPSEIAETLMSMAGSAARSRPAGAPGAPAAPMALAGGGGLKIVTSGNRLILSGPRTDLAKAILLFEQIDVVDQQPVTRKYAVKDAEEDGKKLQALLGLAGGGAPAPAAPGPGGAPGRPAASTARAMTSGSVSVVPDTYENVLLVRALPKDFAVIDEQLRVILGESQIVEGTEGDVGGDKGMMIGNFFPYQLKYKKAWDISWTLEDVIGSSTKGGIKFEEGPDEYTLLVKNCKPAQKDDVIEVIKMFDVPPPPEKGLIPGTVVVEAKDLPAEQLRKLIDEHYSSPTGDKIKWVGAGADGTRAPIVDIHADEEKDTQDSTPKAPAVSPCVLPLSLMKSLDAVACMTLDDPPAGPPQEAAEPTSQPAEPPRHVKRIIFPTTTSAPTIVPPKGGLPTAQSKLPSPPIPAIAPDGAPSTTTSAPAEPREVTALIDPETGKLIFSGPQSELDAIAKIAEELQGGKSPTVYRVFPLKYVDVNTASQLLNNIFNQQQAVVPQQRQRQQGGQQPGGQKGAQPAAQGGKPGEAGGKEGRQPQQPEPAPAQTPGRIKVIPDARIRALYVIAPLSDIPVIVDILRHIDKKMPPGEQNIKIFKLLNLDATQVVQNLKDVLGLGGSTRGARQVMPGQRGQMTPEQMQQMQQQQQQMLQMQGQEGQGVLLTGEDNVKLTAVTQINSIIAQAPPDTLTLIDSLIKQMEEQPDTTKQEMRRVPLLHARATDVATIVRDVAGKIVAGAPGGAPGAPGGGGRRSTGAMSVNADPRTNSVILAGPMMDLDATEKVVKELDVDDGSGSNIHQFAVKGDAQSIATALKSVFVTGGPQAQDVVITADSSTNTIVVKANTKLMTDIEKQITELDSKVAVAQQQRSIKLQFGDAETTAANLTAIFADAKTKKGAKQNITIKGVKSNNTIYISGADDEVFEQISSLTKDMDTAPSGIQVKTFPLKYASATDVEQKLTAMMAKAMQGGGLGNFKLDLIGAVADTRTNSLIVTGGPVTFMLIEDVLKAVDVLPQSPLETRSYALKPPANAADAARNINELFRDENVKTTGSAAPAVTANVPANIVTVTANATQHKKIQENIIEPLLTAMGEPPQDYQVPLKHARADEIKPVIEDFMKKWQQSGGNRPQDAFNIAADANSNMLLLICSPSTKAVFDKQLAELDKADGGTNDFVYKVKHARAVDLAKTLTDQIGKTRKPAQGRMPVNVIGDDATNTLVISGPQNEYEAVMKLIAELDVEGAAERLSRAFTVKFVTPSTMAQIINQQFQRPGRPAAEQVNASYEDGTRSIIVRADPKTMEEVAKFIEDTDKLGSQVAKETRFIQLKVARADDLVKPLTEAIQARMMPDGRGKYPVSIVADVASNNLVVTAPPESFPDVEKMVAELDKEGERLRKEYVIEVANGNPNDVATALQGIFDAAARVRPGQSAATVKAIPGTTKILAYVNEQEKQQLDNLIKRIDVEGGRIVHSVSMSEMVAAKSVSDNINKLFGGGGAQGAKRDGPYADFHEATNTLLVYATDAEYEKINDQVIKTLSQQPTIGVLKIFKIPLKYAVADEVAKTLQDFFDKKAGVQRQGGARPWWAEGGSDLNKKLENQVTIMAEPASNMLIAYCTDTTKEIIDDLLKDIDTDEPPGGKKQMEMVALKYMDAADMLPILTEYLKVSKRTPEATTDSTPWWAGGGRRGAGQEQEKVVLAGDTRLTTVESLNAIIVVGKPESVQDVLAKIKELDMETVNGPDVPQQIKLAHANAAVMADTLNRTFNDPSRKKGTGSTSIAPTIVSDEATNMLFVRAKPAEFALIRKMAESLDSEMAEVPSGVQILEVPVGRNVEELARTVEEQINKNEDNKKALNKDYRPSKVSIGADTVANALLVAGSKAQFDEVRRIVDRLIEMGPAGGVGGTVIRLKNLSPEKAKALIEQLQQGGQGKGGGAKSSGKRGDADWTQKRRYEKGRDSSRSRIAFATTLPVFLTQVALSTAIAQAPSTQPATSQPKTFTIKQVEEKQPPAAPAGAKESPKPTTQPAEPKGSKAPKKEPRADAKETKPQPSERGTPAKPAAEPKKGPQEPPRPAARPGGAQPPPAAGRGQPGEPPAVGRQLTLEDVMRATSQPATSALSPEAQEALRKRLSGAPITVSEAGPDSMFVQGNEQDLALIESIVNALDTALPKKNVEYVRLTNARAADLAKTLQDVLQRTVARSGRPERPEDKVDIIADPRTNGLYIAATEERMAEVMTLVQQNETASKDIDKRVRSFTLQNRRVTEAGEVLKKMVKSYLDQMGLPATAITVEIDPQTNSVLITGGESDLAFVEKIIESLDAELPETKEGAKAPMGQADIMVVPLKIAQADTLAKLLDELMKKAATGDTPMKDFIRRMRLLDEKGEVIAAVDLNRPIVIFGDKESNSLLIASSKENCFIMKQVAEAFDREPAKADVDYKLIQLQYADADGVAEQLSKFLKDCEELTLRASGKGDKSGVPGGDAGSLVYRAVVKADPRTNQVMLVGRPDALPLLEEMIKSIDVKGLDVMPFEIIKLEYASASALETALTEMMKDRADALPKGTGPNADKAEKVVIKGDPRSRSLIVAAKAARMEELRKLIKELDIPATALIEDIRTITVRKSSATDLADKLKKLWEDRQKQQESGSKGLKLEIPAIVADERSNSLIVAAAKADFEAIKSLVDKIEALELNPMANIYVVRLKYNTAKQLSSALKALFDKRAEMRTVDGKVRPEDKVAIEVDEVTNALLVAASRENYDVLMQKVEELDQELGVPGIVEFFVCDNVGAARVKDTIDELFKEGIYKPGGAGDSSSAKTREKVSATVDDRSNILIVSASPENMDLVREIYKRMNSVSTPWDAAITKLIIIQYGDAVKIAAQVKDHFTNLDKIRQEGSSGGKSKAAFGITVFADERSNRIVVGGTKDGIDSAVDMIEKLDVPPGEPGSTPVVYRLKEAPASKVGEMIKNIFEERNQPRQGATGPQIPNVKVTVESNDSSNSLVINAAKEDHILIADLIGRLDRPSTLIDMVKVFPLEKARSDRVKEILDELYKSAGGTDSKGGKTIAVVEDKRTNAVVVAAPPGELENLTSLIARLDDTEVKGQAEVGVFLCENEDAKKMAEMLNEIMTGKSATGGGGTSGGKEEGQRDLSSMLISYAAKDPRGKEIFLKAIRENVQISYSERANSIIAVAPPSSLKLIESLVRQLDQTEKRPVLVKVFSLINSDAQSITELLDKVFANKEGTEAEKAFQKDREMRVEGGVSSTGGAPTAASQEGAAAKGTFGRPKTTYVPDQRTNSVIAAGWPEDIDVIADIIDQLDSRSIQDRDNVVVALVNMKAKDVQTALDSFIKAEQARLDKISQDISVQRRMEQEISVIAHEESNQLIVSASPRYKPQILSIIEQLDQAPPQVMIQVMLAEVTLDDRFEMGMEFALQQLRFSETAVADANGILQSSHFDVVGGTDVGAAGSGLAGFSFTITGEDFNFLVRALQSDSRLEVIQRPMVMCQDNMKANITVGQQVPFIRGTQVTTAGQVTSQVEYEKVGIILDVEPHINPDGFVFLKVKPEISAIATSTIDIGNGVLAPVFTTRSAETTVAVKDGETVVIGGLITTTESEAESKVPFLGDIPGLGILFRATTRSKNRTELLVALTPRVVRTIEDGRRISVESRDASGIITDEMKASPLFGGLRLQPEAESEVLEIETPPGTAESPAAAHAPQPGMETEPGAPPVPASPTSEPKPEEKYGPTAPRYGPSLPSDEDAVARRDKAKKQAVSMAGK
jgi:type II secretory pathway component GspD/PulD (secretin)